MKRIFLKFGISCGIFLAFALPSFAILTTDEAISPAYVKNHGDSYEMCHLVDLQKAQINGTQPTYTPPGKIYKFKPIKFIRRMAMYFDSGLDDGMFMRNNIDYTTRWDDL